MRNPFPPILEKNRVTTGRFATKHGDRYGKFIIKKLFITAHAAEHSLEGWEHGAVELKNRIPTWDEMCLVKSLLWEDEDCVIQFHPPKSVYVNARPFMLHLWRNINFTYNTPPIRLIVPL